MRTIIAGPVFPEWYWGPIFVGVPLPLASLVFDGLVTFVLRRRGGGPRTILVHVKTAGAFALTGAIVLYGSVLYREHRERQDRIDRALAAIDFPLYEPASLPADVRVLWVFPSPSGPRGAELIGGYSGPGGTLTVTQRATDPTLVEELAGRCFAGPRGPGGPTEYNPPSCRPHPTPGGRNVSDDGHEIVARLGATRLSVGYDASLPRAALERFVDALRVTPKDELRLVSGR